MYLHDKNISTIKSVNHINLMKNQLTFIRKNRTSEFKKIFMELSKRLNYFESKVKISRLANHQKKKAKDAEEYFKKILPILFLDSFIEQFNDCFINHENIITVFQILVKSSEFNEEKLKKSVEFYDSDIDDFNRVKSEITMESIFG